MSSTGRREHETFESPVALAAQLKELRQKAGLTQAVLAGLMRRIGRGAFDPVFWLERGL